MAKVVVKEDFTVFDLVTFSCRGSLGRSRIFDRGLLYLLFPFPILSGLFSEAEVSTVCKRYREKWVCAVDGKAEEFMSLISFSSS